MRNVEGDDLKKMNKQKFDLTEKRPQVLLFGNGLVYNKKWDEVIDDLKDENEENFLKGTDVPYPLQSSVLFYKDDKTRQDAYKKYFNTGIENELK